MRNDIIQQYLASHEALKREKSVLESRLARVNQALSGRIMISAARAPVALTAPRRGRRLAKRMSNSLSLAEAIRKVTSAKPLTKPEILAGIKKLGYKFESTNPINSVNVKLYTRGLFHRRPGGRSAPPSRHRSSIRTARADRTPILACKSSHVGQARHSLPRRACRPGHTRRPIRQGRSR